MKPTKLLITMLTGSLLAIAAQAQVDFTFTGSTAFRAISLDRAKSLFDPGYTTWGDTTNIGFGTVSGTVSNVIPTLGATTVNLRFNFSGSAAGMLAVDHSTLIATINPGTGTTNNFVPDVAMSDVYPESASPPINGSDFDQSIVGVIPFVWVANNTLFGAGVTNLTREQAVLLMTASGVQGGFPGMTAGYLAGNGNTNVIYLTGRDSGSGTRITTLKDIGFTGVPTEWGTGPGPSLVITNGYSSGGGERNVIAQWPYVIGYLGLSDANAIAASASRLSYEGFPFSIAGVQNGTYPYWGYEHMVNRAGQLSANKQAIHDALVAAITDPGFQTTNSLYSAQFVDQGNMQVQRGTDGGTITSLNF